MSFNPLTAKGIPIEQQFKNWKELAVKPYNKKEVHPYTRTRIILMNGIEVEGAIFKHQFARHCDDQKVKQELAMTRRVEQMQQKMVNWFSPGDESVLEVTIGYEQVAVDLTAWLARNEKDKNVKAALDYALLEDFDHLYRYANLLDLRGIKAENIVGEYTEIFPGRPTISEHCHPTDTIKTPVNNKKADIQTILNIMTIVAGEQQTMNFYMNVGSIDADPVARSFYQEIGMIEEQHVSHYESLLDPTTTWAERALMHEYLECYLYYSFMQDETDDRMKKYWEQCLMEEVTHLQMAAKLFKEKDKRDPEELIPDKMPELVKFESNKDYVRDILKKEVDKTTVLTGYEDKTNLSTDHRYFQYQGKVNENVAVPSQKAIEIHIKEKGKDYRQEINGPHPIERFRQKEKALV